jgi:hypothetical protein
MDREFLRTRKDRCVVSQDHSEGVVEHIGSKVYQSTMA